MVSGALTVLLTAPAGIQATAPPGPPSWTPGDVWLSASDTGNVTKRVEVLGEEDVSFNGSTHRVYRLLLERGDLQLKDFRFRGAPLRILGLDAPAVMGAAGAAVAGAEYWRRTRERRPGSPPGRDSLRPDPRKERKDPQPGWLPVRT